MIVSCACTVVTTEEDVWAQLSEAVVQKVPRCPPPEHNVPGFLAAKAGC